MCPGGLSSVECSPPGTDDLQCWPVMGNLQLLKLFMRVTGAALTNPRSGTDQPQQLVNRGDDNVDEFDGC